MESFRKSALEGLMESVNIDDSFNDDDFVDIDDHSENGNDGSLGEIEELKAENLGLRERIQKYETELMQLVEQCNKCPQCSISL